MTHALCESPSILHHAKGQVLPLMPSALFAELDGFQNRERQIGIATVNTQELRVRPDVPREDADFPDPATVGPAGLCCRDSQERDVAATVEPAEAGPELGIGEHGQTYAMFGTRSVYPFQYHQKRFLSRLEGFRCRIVAEGTQESVLLEFETGERVVATRGVIRGVA